MPALALGYAMEPVTRDGVQLSPSADVSEVSLDPALQWQALVDGRFPTRPGEALADANAAKSTGVEVGDVLRVGTGDAATDVEVVGLVDSPAAATASLYVPWETLQRFRGTLWVDAVAWGGPTDLAAQVAPGATIESSDDWVAARQAEISRGVDILAVMALMFVFIALFVGVMVIANTFAILFAQRMRDFALLRCVGVTRRQLRRAVRLEALAIGVAASVVGLVAGTVLGYGLIALVRHWYADMGAAAHRPALDRWGLRRRRGRHAARRLAADPRRPPGSRRSRHCDPTPASTYAPQPGGSGSRWPAWCSSAGGAMLAASVATHTAPVMLAGGAAFFVGVLLLGPVLVPALIRLVGRARRLGPRAPARGRQRGAQPAAYGDHRRVPARRGHPHDRRADRAGLLPHRAGQGDGRGLPASTCRSPPSTARSTPTWPTAPLPSTAWRRRPRSTAPWPRSARSRSRWWLRVRRPVVRGPDDLAPADGVLVLPYDVVNELPAKIGDRVRADEEVTITVGDRERTLEVRTGSGWGRSGLVSAATLASLDPDPMPSAIWVRATDGADAEDLRGDLAALAGAAGAGLDGGYSNRAWVDLQVDILTGAVVGLLAIAIVIALVGIAQHPRPLGPRAGPRERAAAGDGPDPDAAAPRDGGRGAAAVSGGDVPRHRARACCSRGWA